MNWLIRFNELEMAINVNQKIAFGITSAVTEKLSHLQTNCAHIFAHLIIKGSMPESQAFSEEIIFKISYFWSIQQMFYSSTFAFIVNNFLFLRQRNPFTNQSQNIYMKVLSLLMSEYVKRIQMFYSTDEISCMFILSYGLCLM